MATSNLETGIMFLLQTIFGILGNFSLLYHYLFLHFREYRLRSADLFCKHLMLANFLVILFKAVPETMAAFGLKHFLGDIGCKLVFYIQNVSTNVSVDTTCLLAVFRAITISPTNSRWAQLKVKAAKNMGIATFLCWILHMMLHTLVPVYVTGKLNKNITKRDHGYCYSVLHDKITGSLYVVYIALVLFHNGFCLGLMICASVSMVHILHRHEQRVRYIHNNHLSPQSSTKTRGTQKLLVLVSTFVSFFTLSSIFHICLAIFNRPSVWLLKSTKLVTVCFPTVSPYILMSQDSRVSRPCLAWIRNTKSPSISRKK